MKVPRIARKSVYLTSPMMFRAVTVGRKKRHLMLLYNYGTSKSEPSQISKSNLFNSWKISSDNFIPVIYKSVTLVSSLLTSLTTRLKKSSETDHKLEDRLKNEENIKLVVETKSKLTSDDSKTSELTLDLRPKSTVPSLEKPEDRELEQSFFEWLAGGDLRTKRKEFLEKDEKKEKTKKPYISKSSLEQRSRFLVSSLSDASSSGSKLLRLEEICKHLLLYPEQKAIMCKAGLLPTMLCLKYDTSDRAIQAQASCALALIGYHNPLKGEGIRILSIDGGGTRGIMAIEVLRQLEAKTNKKVYQLFDYMCGVSSGAVLTFLLGGLRMSLDECEYLYRKLSDEVFNQSSLWGTGRLVWSHAYYDTTAWVNVLKRTFGENLIIDTAKDKDSPKLAAVSAIMNLPQLEPFVFRNYDFPPRVQSYYKGSCRYRMWEAIRASGAAPGYFQEYCLDDYLHQDGGVMINNPTALGIHEARLLWPSDPIQCVLSLGSGRYIPSVMPNVTSTSLKTKVLKIIDSATDTESVHIAVNDLLTPDTYFRINPYLTEFLTLDENRKEKLDQMKIDAQMYLRRNEYKFTSAARTLQFHRSYLKQAKDWLKIQKDMIL